MHEYSLIRALLDQVAKTVRTSTFDPMQQPSTRVHQITASTGPLSGVEPLLVSEAFQLLKHEVELEGVELENATLVIEEIDLMAVCSVCDQNFEVHDFVFRCPKCGSQSVRITQGDAFRLLRIEVEDGDPTACITEGVMER